MSLYHETTKRIKYDAFMPMIRFHLAQLMADVQFKTGRRITLVELTEATGISRITLSRMLNVRGYSTSTETIDKLCRYFGCEIAAVATYVDDEALLATNAPVAIGPRGDKTRRVGAVKVKPPKE